MSEFLSLIPGCLGFLGSLCIFRQTLRINQINKGLYQLEGIRKRDKLPPKARASLERASVGLRNRNWQGWRPLDGWLLYLGIALVGLSFLSEVVLAIVEG